MNVIGTLFIILCMTIIFIIKLWLNNPTTIGKIGEKRIKRKLAWLSNEYITFNDIYLQTGFGTSQIDHLIVSPYGIFIIETKNYKGIIVGSEQAEQWKQYLYGGKSFWGRKSKMYPLYNPIRQNKSHVNVIKSTLKKIGNFEIISIIVFPNNTILRTFTPNYHVTSSSNLRSIIKSYKNRCISDADINRIASKIESSIITHKNIHQEHIKNVQQNIHRKKQYIENGICPKCNSQLVKRKGKYGYFMGCSNYPKCNFTCNI